MSSKRKPNWREDESVLLAEEVVKRRDIIKGKAPTYTSKDKKNAWTAISENISAAFRFATRTPEECEKRWYAVLMKCRGEITAYRESQESDGGTPPKPLSALAVCVQQYLGLCKVPVSPVPSHDTPLLQVMKIEDRKFLEPIITPIVPVEDSWTRPHTPSDEELTLDQLKREKIKMQMKVLKLQEEYYTLKIKKLNK
ncbi:uncharacterized protein Hap1MRO34_002023 [Clarias gariepinus]